MQVLSRIFFPRPLKPATNIVSERFRLGTFPRLSLWLMSGCTQVVVIFVLFICWVVLLLGVVAISTVAVCVGFVTSLGLVHKFKLILNRHLLELISQQRTAKKESLRLTDVQGFCLAWLSLEDEVHWNKLESCLSFEDVATAWVG